MHLARQGEEKTTDLRNLVRNTIAIFAAACATEGGLDCLPKSTPNCRDGRLHGSAMAPERVPDAHEALSVNR
jgi:hypothetical protein